VLLQLLSQGWITAVRSQHSVGQTDRQTYEIRTVLRCWTWTAHNCHSPSDILLCSILLRMCEAPTPAACNVTLTNYVIRLPLPAPPGSRQNAAGKYQTGRDNLFWYYASDIRSRNLYPKLKQVSVNLVQVFFWYKFLACNRTELYSSTETVWHVTRTVQCDWPESCCARNCDELVSFFHASFLCKILECVSPVLPWECGPLCHGITVGMGIAEGLKKQCKIEP